MTPAGYLALALLALLLAVGLVIGVALARYTPRSSAATALGGGRFAAALADADTAPDAQREDLYVAAVAAKHLLVFDRAAKLLDRIIATAPDDGEAWLELGLVTAYAGRPDEALPALTRAQSCRADLAEPLALHRAWVLLRLGATEDALRLFEEIEAPLDSKLRADLGGDPLFVEWFLQAAALWEARGDSDRARQARRVARSASGDSRLPDLLT